MNAAIAARVLADSAPRASDRLLVAKMIRGLCTTTPKALSAYFAERIVVGSAVFYRRPLRGECSVEDIEDPTLHHLAIVINAWKEVTGEVGTPAELDAMLLSAFGIAPTTKRLVPINGELVQPGIAFTLDAEYWPGANFVQAHREVREAAKRRRAAGALALALVQVETGASLERARENAADALEVLTT